jgi:molecular chaperone GrpE
MPVAGFPVIVYFDALELSFETMNKEDLHIENDVAPTEAEPIVAVPLTPQQIEELKLRAAKADENWERLLRTTADFDNFKKRSARERTEAVQFANAALIQKLLPVLDNFEMALAAVQSAKDEKTASLQAGINMVQSQLKNILVEAGLEEIDATGRTFDAAVHEAISQQETASVPEGQVVQQVRKGYKLRERLLRPATVIVAKKPGAK